MDLNLQAHLQHFHLCLAFPEHHSIRIQPNKHKSDRLVDSFYETEVCYTKEDKITSLRGNSFNDFAKNLTAFT